MFKEINLHTMDFLWQTKLVYGIFFGVKIVHLQLCSNYTPRKDSSISYQFIFNILCLYSRLLIGSPHPK